MARELLGGRAEVRLVTLDGDAGEPAAAAHARRARPTRTASTRHEALDAPALGWAVEILQAQVVDVKLNS